MGQVKYKRRDELELELIKAKDEISKLKAICKELVNLPKGVESHSYSDYKMKNA